MKNSLAECDVINRMIQDRCISTYKKDITKEHYDDFVKHWFETAETIKEEMLRDGLQETSKVIQEIIDFNRNVMKTK